MRKALSLRLVRHCHVSGRMNLDSVIEVNELYSGLKGDIRVRPLTWQCLTRRRDNYRQLSLKKKFGEVWGMWGRMLRARC